MSLASDLSSMISSMEAQGPSGTSRAIPEQATTFFSRLYAAGLHEEAIHMRSLWERMDACLNQAYTKAVAKKL